jgi:RHS repeat-associated protein
MGYHLTTSLAWPCARSHASPKTHVPGSRLQERGHRYYSANLGRWVSRDPIGERGGANQYAANGNDGMNYFDPSGLQRTTGDSCCCCCAESVSADVVRAIVQRRPLDLIFGHVLKFDLAMSYILKPPFRDCKYKWEEKSSRAFRSVPGDGLFHDVTGQASSSGSTKDWEEKREPCVTRSVSFNDHPRWTWQVGENPSPLPWEWNHSIKITLKSGDGCPCTFRQCTVTVKRHTVIKTLAPGDFDLTADAIDQQCN